MAHVTVLELETSHGTARVHLRRARKPRAALALGHGAGGGVGAPDLVATTEAALSEHVSVALVEQPFRVADRRSPPPAAQLDEAWTTVVGRLRERELAGLPLVVGGRSLGARVACRTAEATGAIAVLCLAFPLVPPRRAGTPTTRLPELDAVEVPTLVVQGASDRFGMPPSGASRRVAIVPGDHGLKKDVDAVREAVREWLEEILASLAQRARASSRRGDG